MSISLNRLMCGILASALAAGLQARDENYADVQADLAGGVELQRLAERAYRNADRYWEPVHGHQRDGHDHPPDNPLLHDGADEKLSAGEAVTEIFTRANAMNGQADPAARDIVRVAIAVIDAWPECEDTFDAVRAAVELMPNRADEIVAGVAVKRDCNCHNGGLWLDRRVQDRLRVELRHVILDAPFQCSCSQVAMYGGIAGLPENRAYDETLPEEQKQALIARLTERVSLITERTAAMQSRNGWDCGCSDINIAASMQGIRTDELREGTFDGLAQKYVAEAGDSGLVVDAFGVVGMYPAVHWGDGQSASQSNDLRRKGEVYRGDNLLLDPFDPATEYSAHGDHNLDNLGRHQVTSVNIPTDLIISEYLEGWNGEALQQPESGREPEQRNRVLELYNGGEETIDLGNGQYFLEIYGPAGAAAVTHTVAAPPVLVKKTISLQSDVTFEFDKSDIRPEAGADLDRIVNVLNEAQLFSEIVIVGHTCDLGSDEYNLTLSERRADAVRDYLQRSGLKDVQIRTEGHGEREPRLPNTSEANRSRNRRVDITFVMKEGEQVETAVSEAAPGAPKKYDYTFLLPLPPSVHEVESAAAGGMAAGEYVQGDMSPRQVIGLNGAIGPKETYIIAFSESDEAIRDIAQQVTGQLDFRPNETLVVRRLGQDMALNCRAQNYAYVTSYPALPIIRSPAPDPNPTPRPPNDEVASPN